jgi:hypothetical protein
MQADDDTMVSQLRTRFTSDFTSAQRQTGTIGAGKLTTIGSSHPTVYATSVLNPPTGYLATPTQPVFRVPRRITESGRIYYENTDVEYRILEWAASRLGSSYSTQGTLHIAIANRQGLDACSSCSSMMAQFLQRYPNITIFFSFGPNVQ